MRFRNYTTNEIFAASVDELEAMHANNERVIQFLDFGIVFAGAVGVLAILDMLHL